MSIETRDGVVPNWKKNGLRLEVRCAHDHPIEIPLAARGYHRDPVEKCWWRQFTKEERDWIQDEMRKHRPSPSFKESPNDPALVVAGNTAKFTEALTAHGCQFLHGEWVAPSRELALKMRLAVALSRMKALGLPIPPKELHFPPPAFVLCGKMPAAEEAELTALGARWIPDWGCWSIDADKDKSARVFSVVEDMLRPLSRDRALEILLDLANGRCPWTDSELPAKDSTSSLPVRRALALAAEALRDAGE